MALLCRDEFAGDRAVELGSPLTRVGRTDPIPVLDADVAVVRQQPMHLTAVMAGVAARTPRLGLVTPGDAKLPTRVPECGVRAARLPDP